MEKHNKTSRKPLDNDMKQSSNKKSLRRGHIIIFQDTCKGCGLCISVCPRQMIILSDVLNEKGYYPAAFLGASESGDGRFCNGCATCAIICPDVAIEVYRD